MKEQADRIEDALRKSQVLALDPARRRRIAQDLAAQGVSSGQAVMVWHECRGSTGDLNQARGLFATVLADIGRFREVVKDLEETERRKREQGQVASLEFVTETNPWGWPDPERMRYLDHERPGDWNPFRRSQNLTLSEAREAGTGDVRRHGCSRPEVLGEPDYEKVRRIRSGKGKPGEVIKDATAYWDELPVQCARNVAMRSDTETPERQVYGEAQP